MSDTTAATSIGKSSPVRGSPMPTRIPDSNKKRAVSVDSDDPQPCRILCLPDELRLAIYRWILPYGQHIFLDPVNVLTPSPHAEVVGRGEHIHKNVMSLLLVSKQVHAEIIEFVFTKNIVTIQKPLDRGDFLAGLGEAACKSITHLECFVGIGLAELGNVWKTMNDCPKLESLRLAFYHERTHWSVTLAELANYIMFHEACDLQLEVELHTSVYPRHYKSAEQYQTDFSKHLDLTDAATEVYTFDLPLPLKKITVTASVLGEAAYGFATLETWCEWRFETIRTTGTTDAVGKKLLRWEKTADA